MFHKEYLNNWIKRLDASLCLSCGTCMVDSENEDLTFLLQHCQPQTCQYILENCLGQSLTVDISENTVEPKDLQKIPINQQEINIFENSKK